MRILTCSAIALLVFVSPAMAVKLITNGSFETGDLTGWTVDPFGQGHRTAVVYTGSYCCEGATPPDGLYASAFGGGGPNSGEIAQAFATVAGQTYTGSLQYAGVSSNSSFNDSVIQVTIGDANTLTPILGPVTLTPSFDGNWKTYTFSFVATSNLSGIDIYGPSDGTCCSDTMVDKVIVVPEPASLGLLGFFAAGLLRRRGIRG